MYLDILLRKFFCERESNLAYYLSYALQKSTHSFFHPLPLLVWVVMSVFILLFADINYLNIWEKSLQWLTV